jgi:outer membrane protein assembly factor BamB
MKLRSQLAFCLSVMALLALPLRAGDWPTFGHDPQRSGWAVDETGLNPQTVGNLMLKWKAKLPVQPRSLTALSAPVVATDVMTVKGPKTVVYIAGSDDQFFAIDAANGGVLWSHDFETHTLPKDAGMWLCPNNANATPTIDRSRNLVFSVASDGRIYGMDLSTGEVRFGPVQFVPAYAKDWSLNLDHGFVYTSISQGCGGAQSGIYTVDTHDPNRPAVQYLFVAKNGAGVWGRGGPVIGRNGRVYADTGDGDFDPDNANYGSAFIAASLPDLHVVDYYAPLNNLKVSQYDLDISSAGPTWFAHRDFNLLAGGGKEGVLYLLDADSLGSKDHQTPLAALKLANDDLAYEGMGIWGATSLWRDGNGRTWLAVPIWGPPSKQAPAFPQENGDCPHGSIMTFEVLLDPSTGRPTLKPAWVSGDLNVPEPVAIANGVVFALATGENTAQATGSNVIFKSQKLYTDQERSTKTHHAELFALDAQTGKTLFRSAEAMTGWTHFSGLALAENKVFAVDHDSQLYCFGLKGTEK